MGDDMDAPLQIGVELRQTKLAMLVNEEERPT
jgi:hypothetical protein